MKIPKLLDTTLRDGSYVIDFQFTPKDTATIGAALDAADIDFIEVGHGLGLGAGMKPHMKAPAPDRGYLEAAAQAIKKNDWGMFFIPGIGTLEDIDIASSYGMKFIRIGTDVDRSEDAAPFIERAKKHGMYVAANFMKTYALDFDSVGKRAALSQNYGADIVCIVDSAGGMFPRDVEQYYHSIRNQSDVKIGFHGHNNLGMAMANTLKAVEIGCDVVDTSIRGMGRSAGNAITEMFLFSMDRMGMGLKSDVHKVLQIADEYIDPLLKNYQQINSIGVVSGYAQFHSSYMGKISQYADAYQVDPKKLIINVSNINKITVTDELVEQEAKKLKQVGNRHSRPVYAISIPEYNLREDNDFPTQLLAGIDLVNAMAKRYANKSVLNIVQDSSSKSPSVSQVVNEGNNFSVISLILKSKEEASIVRKLASERVDHLLLDIDNKHEESEEIISVFNDLRGTDKLVCYSDLEIWAKAVVTIVLHNIGQGKKVFAVGDSLLSRNVRSQLVNFNIELAPAESFSNGIIILFEPLPAAIFDKALKSCTHVIDAVLGSVQPNQLTPLLDKGISILRPQMHSYIHSEIDAQLSTNQKHITIQGVGTVNGIRIASGGFVASKGTVIVDNINRPRKIFGIANGQGFLLSDYEMDKADREKISNLGNLLAEKFSND